MLLTSFSIHPTLPLFYLQHSPTIPSIHLEFPLHELRASAHVCNAFCWSTNTASVGCAYCFFVRSTFFHFPSVSFHISEVGK